MRNHQSSTLKNNGRLLNEALQDAKNMANDTYNGLKRTVMDNMVLSIVLASAVLALLILCCYLRRKYTRSAQVVSKREYKKLLRERKRREMEIQKRRRGHGGRSSKKQGRDGDNRERSRMYAARSRLREDEKLRRKDRLFLLDKDEEDKERGRGVDATGRVVGVGGAFAANTSLETIETMSTMMSQEDIEYVDDVEHGNEGFEVEISPIKVPKEEEDISNGHYLENDVHFEDETPQKKKRFQFLKKKNDQQFAV